jgi:hypothetical protein
MTESTSKSQNPMRGIVMGFLGMYVLGSLTGMVLESQAHKSQDKRLNLKIEELQKELDYYKIRNLPEAIYYPYGHASYSKK